MPPGEKRGLGTKFLHWSDRFINWWSAAAGAGVLTVGGLTAWAASAAQLLVAYSPFSWIATGILGALVTGTTFFLVQAAARLRLRTRFDARSLEGPSPVNPLEKTFINRRIYLNDFVLPSLTAIARKTFIDCEIVGPANLYWWRGNSATDLVGPQMDAVYFEPNRRFFNGITLDNCVFRGCSFQRITLFVGAPEYPAVKDNGILNWISETPVSIGAASAQPSLPIPQSSTPAPDQRQ
jgi:hypothetical protein